jgi:hypothetical protein
MACLSAPSSGGGLEMNLIWYLEKQSNAHPPLLAVGLRRARNHLKRSVLMRRNVVPPLNIEDMSDSLVTSGGNPTLLRPAATIWARS